MKNRHAANLGRAAVILALAIASPIVLGQRIPEAIFDQSTFLSPQRQEQLQQILSDKSGYAAAIVQRWEDSARASGRWNENYSVELQGALMTLQPANLLAAGEASSYEAMRTVVATGRATLATTRVPLALGDFADDMVYTSLTPCRMVDTRFATPAGPLASLSTNSYDADGSNFSNQGGSATGCGVPYDAAYAIAATITIVNTSASGFLAAWAWGGAIPNASVINWDHANATLANTTIIPISPGVGADFSIYSYGTTNVIVDVVGYYARPGATALDCLNVATAETAVPVNVWTNIQADCPAGYAATGGGWWTSEGSGGWPGVWILSIPNGNGWLTTVDNQTSGARNVQGWCRCCRVPGR
jgi:hypothetical protein